TVAYRSLRARFLLSLTATAPTGFRPASKTRRPSRGSVLVGTPSLMTVRATRIRKLGRPKTKNRILRIAAYAQRGAKCLEEPRFRTCRPCQRGQFDSLGCAWPLGFCRFF